MIRMLPPSAYPRALLILTCVSKKRFFKSHEHSCQCCCFLSPSFHFSYLTGWVAPLPFPPTMALFTAALIVVHFANSSMFPPVATDRVCRGPNGKRRQEHIAMHTILENVSVFPLPCNSLTATPRKEMNLCFDDFRLHHTASSHQLPLLKAVDQKSVSGSFFGPFNFLAI